MLVSRAHLDSTGGRASAVICTSGNANAQTGAEGRRAADRMCELVARGIGSSPEEVLVCQTGLIGVSFPIANVERGIPALVQAFDGGPDAGRNAAVAMMTTDTVDKQVLVEGGGFSVGGMAKGAAMLAPDMATMLAVLTTDARSDAGSALAHPERCGGRKLQRDDGRRMLLDERHGLAVVEWPCR